MDWRRTLHDVVLVVVLATVLIYWGLGVLGLVDTHISLGTWYKILGRPAIFVPDIIAYFIIGATVGTPTGLLFPCHPIRVALLLALVWEIFVLSAAAGMNILLSGWWIYASDAAAVLFFLPLFAYLGAKLHHHLPSSPGAHCQEHFPANPKGT